VRLRVGERQRRAPGAAEHEPALDSDVLAQLFHVVDQVPRRVVDEARVRPAAATTALVEHDDAITAWVEESAGAYIGTCTRPAMEEDRGLALRVAAFFPVDLVFRRDAQPAAAIRLDLGIQRARCLRRGWVELAWCGHAGIVAS
jgi:hypothetical protein